MRGNHHVPSILIGFVLATIPPLWVQGTSGHWGAPALANEAAKPKNGSNVWIEKFEDPFVGWKDRFFYKHTDAESYRALCGQGPDYRMSEEKGIWIGVRGMDVTAKVMTLHVHPSLGLEASYFSFWVNNHITGLTITFLDKDDKTIAVSCVPQTGYYDYVPVAIRIKNGLKAIRFDGHETQVSGNVSINDVEVIFGPVPKDKDFIIHEFQDGQCKAAPSLKKASQVEP